jgi:uncharacterized protein
VTAFLTAIGLVLVIEGLAFALAPSRIEEALRVLADLSVAQRRSIGVALVTAGVAVVAVVRLTA